MLEPERAEHAIESMMSDNVREYLIDHPEFLDENWDLLAAMVPPVQRLGEGVQDFQRYMLAKLQVSYVTIKTEHDDLIELMQEHMQRQNRINSAILSLIDAPNFDSALKFITTDLSALMDQEAVSLFLEAGGGLPLGNYGGMRVMPEGFICEWIAGRDIELEERIQAAPELFGEKSHLVRSQALIRLYLDNNLPQGLLALGHREPMYYATGIAMEQMECLGAVVERTLRKWICAS